MLDNIYGPQAPTLDENELKIAMIAMFCRTHLEVRSMDQTCKDEFLDFIRVLNLDSELAIVKPYVLE